MSDQGEQSAGGVQSLDSALFLLAELAAKPGPVTLSELARSCGMTPSKSHRYLKSFLNAGFVEQAGQSAKYDLGPAALRLGLSAIARHNFVNRAADRMADLDGETGMSVLLSVWANHGATVVRWERAEAPTVTSMGLGSTMPLLNSATGRTFLAWSPRAPMQKTLDSELTRAQGWPDLVPDMTPTAEGVEAMVSDIRTKGYASVQGSFVPGLVALAAPVLDWQGEAQTVITLLGTDPDVTKPGSGTAAELLATCRSLSFAPVGEAKI